MTKGVYIYYSGATDKTGAALAEALGVAGGTTPPKSAQKVIIGWGAKTDKDVNLGNATVFNHPNAIRTNRNKFRALELMAAGGVNIAPFADSANAIQALDNNTLSLPVIGRTKYHQGGANFIACLTRTHVNEAIKQFKELLKKQSYFQNYIDIVDEYRLHIVGGEVVYAVKKVPRKNMVSAHVEQQSDKIKRMAEKQGKNIDEETLKYALEYQGKKITGPDLVVKSNTRGYKFSSVKLPKVPANLIEQAVNSMHALNLQIGAVDCCVDVNGVPFVIEVNTGPGLEGTPFQAYVKRLQNMINDVIAPQKATATKTEKKVSEDANKGKVKVDANKLRMVADMLDACESDNEIDAVNKVAKRLFG